MSSEWHGPSMLIYKARKAVLISRETAEEIAKRIVHDMWGEDDVRFQCPLDIRNDGDVWTIKGTGQVDPQAQMDMRTRKGRLNMVISKHTGEILKLEH